MKLVRFVPPLATASCVPDQLLLLIVEAVARLPRPRAVRAPESVVAPVPPLARASVPASVNVPLVVMGPPEVVRPVLPPDMATLVTLPTPPDEIHAQTVPSVERILPLLPVWLGSRALMAVAAVDCPVPPLAMLRSVVRVNVPMEASLPHTSALPDAVGAPTPVSLKPPSGMFAVGVVWPSLVSAVVRPVARSAVKALNTEALITVPFTTGWPVLLMANVPLPL